MFLCDRVPFQKICDHCSIVLAEEVPQKSSTCELNPFYRVPAPFYCCVNSCTPSGHLCSYVTCLSLPVAAHLHQKVGVPLASDVSFPTGPHLESFCLRQYAFCQRFPLFWLTSGISRDKFMVSGMIWTMVAVSEHVSFLRGIVVVIWRLDRADCEDFRLNKP
jgi:hypothetical protein